MYVKIQLSLIAILFSLILGAPVLQSKELLSTYERSDWPHWIDSDGDCLNTRHEILLARSLSDITFNSTGCLITDGEWEDYYCPSKLYTSEQIDIDHLVPLKNAAITGGAKWTREKRQIFANDPENLVITSLSYNRSKGPRGIDEWLPLDKSSACRYMRDWIKIKRKYRLLITASEERTVAFSAKDCLRRGYPLR